MILRPAEHADLDPSRPPQGLSGGPLPRLDDRSISPDALAGRTLDWFRDAVGRTPLAHMRVGVDGRLRDIYLKLESANPCGSVKDRTAWSLVQSIGVERLLDQDLVLVESTSGNLGVVLAVIARLAGVRFIAVIDPRTPPRMVAEMRTHAAVLDLVTTPDRFGGYLQNRIRRVRELCATIPGAIWVNQYSSDANPAAHRRATAPEIDMQMDGHTEVVFAPVSTGGTLAGIAGYFRSKRPATRLVAVDAVGSIVFNDHAGPRRLTGIGASRKSDFLRPWQYDEVILVHDAEAFAVCRDLHAATGVALGGSSGAVLAACCRYLSAHPEVRRPVCIVADGGGRYCETIYNDDWLGNADLLRGLARLVSPVSGWRLAFTAIDEVRGCP
jgi:N-(2-amino-2-carboxyethyl)-L-glutamate synthase